MYASKIQPSWHLGFGPGDSKPRTFLRHTVPGLLSPENCVVLIHYIIPSLYMIISFSSFRSQLKHHHVQELNLHLILLKISIVSPNPIILLLNPHYLLTSWFFVIISIILFI